VAVTGHRHGHRSRTLLGTFGQVEIAVPRARLNTPDGKTIEWKSRALRAYQRRTLAADALIAGCYFAGTNTRRVRRALRALFGGAVGKDTVSRVWRKVKSDWEAWNFLKARLFERQSTIRWPHVAGDRVAQIPTTSRAAAWSASKAIMTRERPLFSPSRRRPAPPPAPIAGPPSSPPPPAPPNVTLVGIVMDTQEAPATVR
jgi:Transposase, Mutator family